MSWRLSMQCPHGFVLNVPLSRIEMVERPHKDGLRRSIDVDPEVCSHHAKESKQLLTPDERREPTFLERLRFRRAVRKLERGR